MTSRKNRFFITSCLFLLILLFSKTCFAETHDYSYELLNKPGGSTTYRLRVSIPETLYEYYVNQNHILYHYDFSKFATPDALKPIADDLWSIYDNEEDFSNGVLMLVHQIAYNESDPQKYPMETIVENEGDCDLLSIVAASIIKAGGLDVVLLLLEYYDHMLIGVNLPDTPKDARSQVYYYSYEGKKYYIAETTGGEWKTGWRVGECPEKLQYAIAKIIPLINYEQKAPEQVSSSITIPDSSAVYISLSTNFIISEENVEITGTLTPSKSGEKITLYIGTLGTPMTVLATTETDANGKYEYTWNSSSFGIYSMKAKWSGDISYAETDSDTSNLVVIPFDWLIDGSIFLIVLAFIILITVLIRRKTHNKMSLTE
ncbi:MAG: Ig-like domain-containing protein [Candidatus Bathyarchaeota archaeon]